jgi:hypothetical protein
MDGTYSISGPEGKIRAPLRDLIESKVITEKELLSLIEKMRADKDISIVEFVFDVMTSS